MMELRKSWLASLKGKPGCGMARRCPSCPMSLMTARGEVCHVQAGGQKQDLRVSGAVACRIGGRAAGPQLAWCVCVCVWFTA